jgi:hypothetical protein
MLSSNRGEHTMQRYRQVTREEVLKNTARRLTECACAWEGIAAGDLLDKEFSDQNPYIPKLRRVMEELIVYGY